MEGFIYTAVFLVVFAALLFGYVNNIVKLVKSKEVNGMTLARIVGIFVCPIGFVLGYISN